MLVRILSCAAVVAFAVTAQAGPYRSAIQSSQGANTTFLDESREVFVDADMSGSITPGDSLVGYQRVDTTTPPATSGGNAIYAVFSQTFTAVVPSAGGLPGSTRYAGTFGQTPGGLLNPGSLESLLPTLAPVGGFGAGAMIAIVDVPGGFSADGTLVDLSSTSGIGGVTGFISSVLDAEGSLQASFGLTTVDDYFAFQTNDLGGASPLPDFVVGGIALTETVVTSLGLGNFGAGLSIIDNPFPNQVIYNRVIPSLFTNDLGTFGIAAGGGAALYDFSVTNGNFGGILENPATGALVQNADPSPAGGTDLNFINNADFVVNAVIVPEPTSVSVWAVLVGVGGVAARRRRK